MIRSHRPNFLLLAAFCTTASIATPSDRSISPVHASSPLIGALAPALGAGGGAPVNDHCGDVVPLALANGGSLTFTGTTANATVDGDYEPGSVLDGIGVPVVWIAFSTTTCSNVRIDYCGTTMNVGGNYWNLLAYNCPATNDLVVTQDYNTVDCPDGRPSIYFDDLPAGEHFYPIWYDADNASGPYVIHVSATACAGAPTNDECVAANVHALSPATPVSITGDNSIATDGEGLGYATVWEAFTITECANVTIDYCGTSDFSAFAYGLYSDCPATVLIDTTSTTTCVDGNLSETFNELAPGTYYLPVLMDASDAIGAYTINISAAACIVPPANDECSAAATVTLSVGDTENITGDNTNATNSEGLGYATVWEAFTITECANVTVDYCGTIGFSAFAHGLYSDCPTTAFTDTTSTVACVDGNLSETFEALAAGTYYIPVLMDASDAVGAYTINIAATACIVPPANDECTTAAAAVALVVGSTENINGDNTNATDSEGLGYATVWEAFTITECANVTVDYCGTVDFSAFAYGLYSDCPATLLIDTTSTATCIDGNLSETFEALAAGTYYIPVLMDASDAPGAYTINITATACVVAPPNDECAGAVVAGLVLDEALVIDGDNTNATDSEGLGFNSVWDAFTITECANVTISYCGTTPAFSNVIEQLYVGCASDSIIDATSSDPEACGFGDTNATFTFAGLAAGTYHVPVRMEAGTSEGPYTITLMASACVVPPTNDACSDATPVNVVQPANCEAGSVEGNNTNATQDGLEPECGFPGSAFQDVWFSFNSGFNTEATITITPGTIGEHGVEVFLTCADTSIYCSLTSGDHELSVDPNTDHLVRVFTYDDLSTPGTFTLCVTGDIGTGITTPSIGTLTVYPNPSNGDITITWPGTSTDATLSLFDLTGRTVFSERTMLGAGIPAVLPLAGKLAVGSYVLRLSTPSGVTEQRVVIK